MICHNDVCLENVVFRNGRAVGLLDFDFAPGAADLRPRRFARMCVPIDDDLNAGRLGFGLLDPPGRLRLVADTYGLEAEGRSELVHHLDRSMRGGGEFVQRRVDPVTRTSSACSRRWAGWNATTGDSAGGRKTGSPSSRHWPDCRRVTVPVIEPERLGKVTEGWLPAPGRSDRIVNVRKGAEVHISPRHISSEDPSPQVTKWGTLRRMGSSWASAGS